MSRKLFRQIGVLLAIFFVLSALLNFFRVGFDDTDGEKRSGMGLYVDARTGCHYLSSGLFGGITPRLDKNGRQICN